MRGTQDDRGGVGGPSSPASIRPAPRCLAPPARAPAVGTMSSCCYALVSTAHGPSQAGCRCRGRARPVRCAGTRRSRRSARTSGVRPRSEVRLLRGCVDHPAAPTARSAVRRRCTPSARLTGSRLRIVARRRIDDRDGDRATCPAQARYAASITPEDREARPRSAMGNGGSAPATLARSRPQVRLERDISEYDRYDRLLRYVWVEDASTPSGRLLVNLALARAATPRSSLSTRRRTSTCTSSPAARPRRAARAVGHGCAGRAPDTAGDVACARRRGGLRPGYPDVCIAPSPPDLDCGTSRSARSESLPGPHRFDGDTTASGASGADPAAAAPPDIEASPPGLPRLLDSP